MLTTGSLVYEVIKFTSQYSEGCLVRWFDVLPMETLPLYMMDSRASRKIKGLNKFMSILNAAKFRIQCSDILANYSALVIATER